MSPTGQIYEESRNLRAEGWTAPLTITPKDPLGDPVLPIPANSGHTFTKEHSKSPYKLDTMAASWTLQGPCVQWSTGKRRVIIMTGVTDLTTGIGRVAFTQWRPRGVYAVNPGDPLKCLLVFPCPIVMINGQVTQLLPQRTVAIWTLDPSGIKVWSHYHLRPRRVGSWVWEESRMDGGGGNDGISCSTGDCSSSY